MSRYGSSAAVLDERDERSEEPFEVTAEQEEELARRLEDFEKRRARAPEPAPRQTSPSVTRRRFEILLDARAVKEILVAEAWRREHRDSAAPGAIADELSRISRLLEVTPAIGAPARSTRIAGVRRVLLDRIDYHLYYTINEAQSRVIFLSFWHVRRKPPRL